MVSFSDSVVPTDQDPFRTNKVQRRPTLQRALDPPI